MNNVWQLPTSYLKISALILWSAEILSKHVISLKIKNNSYALKIRK